jgi:1-acyl-sn-glycerol-3-phosphate acyltransferase
MAEIDIGHRYDQSVIDMMYVKSSSYFLRTLDSGKPKVLGLENLLDIPQDTSVVLVSTHKSHLDYVVVPWALKEHQNPKGERPLAIAAGDNLFKQIAKWNFDKFLRTCGAYKIIRNPEPGKRIATIAAQLKYTAERMEAADWFLIFPECARSYTGEVKRFDPAALGIFQRAERKSGRKTVYVPTVIGYERVPEDRWFNAFAKYKTAESRIKKLLYYALDWPLIMAQQYIGIWNKPIGQIIVRFGTPQTSSEGGQPLSKEGFAERMENECKKLVPAFSTNILSTALLESESPAQLHCKIAEVYNHLNQRGVIANPGEQDHISRAARFLSVPLRKFFHASDAYEIKRREIIEYYRNCTAHNFKST